MPRRLRSRTALSVSIAGCALIASTAHAQPAAVEGNFSLDRYEPTPYGDRFFAVQGAATDSASPFRIGVTLDFAKDPLLLQPRRENPDLEDEVVGNQFFGHLGLSYAFFDRVLVEASMPFGFASSGNDPVSADGTQQIASPNGGTIGDLRLGARVRLAGETRGPIELAIGGDIWLPTGMEEEFSGDQRTRVMPYLAVSGKAKIFVYAASGGYMFRRTQRFINVAIANELRYGVAAGVLLANEKLQIGPELYGGTTAAEGVTAFKGRTVYLELLGGAKLRLGPMVLGAAAGPGLSHGIGTPSVRVLGMLAYSPDPETDTDKDGILDRDDACPRDPGVPNDDPRKHGCPPERDADGDGILDEVDACVNVAGVASEDPKKHGCPPDRDGDTILDSVDACPDVPGVANDDPKKNGCPPDRDGDKILDPVDACPDVAGVANDDPKKNGCPPDRDGDGIPDDKDACPDLAGIASDDPAKNGCPGDTDGDGIRDDVDACPREKGKADPDPKKNGCPRLVRVTKEQIEISQQVQFAFGSDKILPASDELLTEVKGVFSDHPEIKKVMIEGHTDNVGADAYNQKLSERRAASVKNWLIAKGVPADRIDSKGFGEAQPIADNKTADGRQKNRRSVFRIVDPAPGASTEPTKVKP